LNPLPLRASDLPASPVEASSPATVAPILPASITMTFFMRPSGSSLQQIDDSHMHFERQPVDRGLALPGIAVH
jgi:hypothetical protein